MSTAVTEQTTREIQAGIYPDLPNDVYHAAPGVSSSMLNDMLRSPLHCWARYLDPDREPQKPSAAMQLGTAVHTAALEPDRWESEYVVAPKCDRRTKAGKAEWEAFQEQAAGRTVVTQEQAHTAQAMARAVRTHPEAAALLAAGAAEHSVFHEHSCGELVKVRPDWWHPGALADLKTTGDASPGGFRRQVARMRYYLQAALYVDTVAAFIGERLPWYWIAVESEPPHAVAVYQADAEALERGRALYHRALSLFVECRRAGRWPGYPDQAQLLSLPGWALYDADKDVLDDPEF